jgi:hypothetical protein
MKTTASKLGITLAGVLALILSPASAGAYERPDPRNQPAAEQRDTKGHMKFLKDTEVFVVLPGRRPVRWTAQKGDCAPLLAIESKKRSPFVSDSIYDDQAILKWGKATITISLGSRHSNETPLTGNAAVALVPAADSETASTRYREGFKEFLAYIAEKERAEDAAESAYIAERQRAETNAHLQSIESELAEQRRQQRQREGGRR